MNAYYRKCWIQQKASAKQRRIPFHFTYAEWLLTWQRSGRLQQRGVGSGCYQMGRRGDVGGYASSNVVIISIEENLRQAAQNRKARLTAASTDWITASSTAAVPW